MIFKRKHSEGGMRYGLTADELTQLATYNAECARGILHAASWKAAMKDLQVRFNQAKAAS